MSGNQPTVFRGEARRPAGRPAEVTVTLTAEGLSVASVTSVAWSAAYRDVTRVVPDAGAVLLELGDGPAPERWLFERFGALTGTLVRGIRDGRLRQWLADGLAAIDEAATIELVEVADGPLTGVAQVLVHDRGIALASLADAAPRLRVRRADIGAVEVVLASGRVRIAGRAGPLARGGVATVDHVELVGLGAQASRMAGEWTGRRDAAAADMAAILAGLVPDLPFDQRSELATMLREGVPVAAADVGDAWAQLESAVLAEPTFAASYRALLAVAGGGSAARRWLALAPETPGASDSPKAWFLVALPGNLVALELVSEGAHATYCFHVTPRTRYVVDADDRDDVGRAVTDISEALIDARFLREPMAIPAVRLTEPRFLRYRLALRALPSLAAARSRFVARIAHRDDASWAAAIGDLVRWHGSARDDDAEWPGRATQERDIADAGDQAIDDDVGSLAGAAAETEG
ncbi:MAG TPA: hypothetical protein VIF84_09910 [Candidatus Limnocylindrales bacterium]|jgi:hypothetical protein